MSYLGAQPEKLRIQSRSLLMTHVGCQLPIEEYKKWIKREIVDKYCKGDIEALNMKHQMHKDKKITIVILITSLQIITRKNRPLDLKTISPTVRILATASDIEDARRLISV